MPSARKNIPVIFAGNYQNNPIGVNSFLASFNDHFHVTPDFRVQDSPVTRLFFPGSFPVNAMRNE
jgi:hypothetical protein